MTFLGSLPSLHVLFPTKKDIVSLHERMVFGLRARVRLNSLNIGMTHPLILTAFVILGLAVATPTLQVKDERPVPSTSALQAFGNGTSVHRVQGATTPAPKIHEGPNGSFEDIPGVITSSCTTGSLSTCIAICGNNDSACLQSASGLGEQCSSSWSSYWDIAIWSNMPPGPSWSTVSSLIGKEASTSTTTLAVYTTFSTSNASFVKELKDDSGGATTMQPVYALGSPVPSVSVTSWGNSQSWAADITGPTPTCKWGGATKISECG